MDVTHRAFSPTNSDGTSDMTLPSFSLRMRSVVRAGLVVTASFGAVATLTAIDAAPVAAAGGELPVNALAPEITAAAEQAVAALEDYKITGSVADERTLAWHRAIAARYTAQELGYDELSMVVAWSSTTLEHQRAVLGALTQVGVPYRTNTSVEGEGFDCSGLTTYAWQGAGFELFRQSGSQISRAKSLARSEAKAGDLVLTMGAGDITGLGPKLLERLRQNSESTS
jgi:cell wall-associated NlpC family hydrolase